MKSLLPLLLAAAGGSACAQTYVNGVPSQTYSQQAVIGPSQTPVNVRHVDELRTISPNQPIMPANAAHVRSQIPVKNIRLGANGTAHLQGTVRGLGMDTYHFSGNAGDTIRIISKKGKAMEYAIFRPDIGMRFGNYQTLPVSGEYELRIVNNRKNSAYNKTPRPYAVTFTLSQGAGAPVSYQAPAAPVQAPAYRTAAPAAVVPVASGPAVVPPRNPNLIARPVNAPAAAPAAVQPRPVNQVLTPAAGKSYVCGTGSSLTAEFQPGVQAVVTQNGKRSVLPFIASASNNVTSKYGTGGDVLTVAHPNGVQQANPDIQQFIRARKTAAENCIPSS